MTPTSTGKLLVCTPSLGRISETFIGRHCRLLAPGATRLAAFDVDSDHPAWASDRIELLPEAPKPWPTATASLRRRLHLPGPQYSQRGVWLLKPEAVERVKLTVREHNIEAVLLEFLDRWLNIIPALRELGVRVVVHGHGYDFSESLLNRRTVEAYRSYLPLADWVVVPSQYAARRLRSAVDLNNLVVVPYGIELPSTATARPSEPDVPRLLAVGRLVPKKNPVGLIDCLAALRRKGRDFSLDLFGDGPLRSQVERAIERNLLDSVVTVHGAAPNDAVLDAMRQADVFVQRSVTARSGDTEGLPLAILEAMARSLPVVSTRHAGIPEAVLDGHTGLLVDETDTEGFAEALSRYLDDMSLAREHGAAGYERVRMRFSWPQNAERLRELLSIAPATPR